MLKLAIIQKVVSIIVVTSVLFLTNNAKSQDFGLDTLALPKYEQVVIENLPQSWWFSTFAETFGDAYPSVRNVLRTRKAKGVRIQLLWSDTHEFGDADIPKIKELSKKYSELLRNFPNVKCEISPFCEHNLSNPDKYLNIAQREAPNCTIVNTVYKGALSAKYKNEIHKDGNPNVPRGSYNFGYDGKDMYQQDVQADKNKHKKADVIFGWTPSKNGKRTESDKTPRHLRKYWLEPKEIKAIHYILTNDKAVNLSLPDKWIWKSNSDRTVTPNPRSLKPSLITTTKLKSDPVLISGDKKLDRGYYSGEWRDEHTNKVLGYIYRFNWWGYELSTKARIANQNRPRVKIFVGNEQVGVVDPAFREGVYR